jgi:hypothetical protein
MILRVRSLLTWVMLVLLLVACTSPAPAPAPTPAQSPLRTSPLKPSPLNTPGVAIPVVPFRLDKPIVEGVDHVTGTGPTGVPIAIADISFMGEMLGTGKIGPDGKFSIKVPVLEKNHRIGLRVGELAGTPWKIEDFYPKGFWGDEATQVPQEGFFHDTTLVRAK